jgi:hypothetical protein
MAKKPTDVSGGSAVPPGKAKTLAGEKKGDVNIEVPLGRMVFEGHTPEIVVVSAQAVEALSVASSTATETGHPEVAKAAEGLRMEFVTINHFYGDNATVHQQQNFDITQHNTTIQKQIEVLEQEAAKAGVDLFNCRDARAACMKEAESKEGLARYLAQAECLALYGTSVGIEIAKAIKPLG